MILLLLALAAILPDGNTLRERCDLIELNHFYDDQARHVFDQLLFYDWSFDDGRYQLRAWRMVKSQSQLPRFDHEQRQWVCEWLDGDNWRRIEAEAVRETWTQYDPELTEREFLPKEKRRDLRPIPKGPKP